MLYEKSFPIYIVRNKGLLIASLTNLPLNKTNAGHQIKSTMRYHVLSLFHFLKLIKRYLTTKFLKARFLFFLFYGHTTERH